MKQMNLKTLFLSVLLATGVFLGSCKSKAKDAGTTDTTTIVTPAEPTPAPVTINEDDSLSRGAIDATKDYPGVKTSVSNGEITLTGEIQRSKLQDLMQSLNSLRPKKINNNLTIK